MTKDFITYDLDTLEIKDKSNSGFTPGYMSLGGDDDKKENQQYHLLFILEAAKYMAKEPMD